MQAQLVEWKKMYPYLALSNSQSLQYAVKQADDAEAQKQQTYCASHHDCDYNVSVNIKNIGLRQTLPGG